MRRLLLANVITALETYLSDSFINRVLNDPKLLQAYIESKPNLKDRKIPYPEIVRAAARVEQDARTELLDTVWHNLSRVKPMYKTVLAVNLGDIGPLMKEIVVRHDIVHRNGRTKDGDLRDVTPDHVSSLIAKVRAVVANIDDQLNPMPEPPDFLSDPEDIPF